MAVARTKHGVVTDVTVLPVHMGQDSAAALKIKTKTAPAQPLKALLHLDEATTTQPTITRAAPLADEVAAAKLSQGKSATARGATQPVVFTSSAPTRTISTTKTTAQPPVTKPIHATNLEIVTEPFVPTPEEASPAKIVKQPLKNRRRPRSPSDTPQDRVDATPRSDRAAHPRVMVHENVVRRSVNLETGKEEIEVVAAGEVAVERFCRRPARNRTVQSGNVTITTDARDQVSTKHRKRRTKLHPFLRRGLPSTPQESRRRRALAVQSGVSRPAPVSIGQVGLEKRRVVAPGEEPDAPLRQSAMPDGYPFSRAWGEGWDTGSTTRSDTRPHPAPRSGRLSAGRLA